MTRSLAAAAALLLVLAAGAEASAGGGRKRGEWRLEPPSPYVVLVSLVGVRADTAIVSEGRQVSRGCASSRRAAPVRLRLSRVRPAEPPASSAPRSCRTTRPVPRCGGRPSAAADH